MLTYDIYEVELVVRDIPDHDISAERVYDMVMNDRWSEWENIGSWDNSDRAYEVWNKIKHQAVSEIREDYDGDEYLFLRVMTMECTDRDEDMDPLDSWELDYCVTSYERGK